MLKITIELISAVTGATSEIGRMFIANDGKGSLVRGDYKVAVCRRGRTMAPRDLVPREGADSAARVGRVIDYPRLAHNVWRLVARSLLAAFPEESKPPKKPTGAPVLTPEVMRGLQLMRKHFEDDGHDWTDGTDMDDFEAAIDWLKAADRED